MDGLDPPLAPNRLAPTSGGSVGPGRTGVSSVAAAKDSRATVAPGHGLDGASSSVQQQTGRAQKTTGYEPGRTTSLCYSASFFLF